MTEVKKVLIKSDKTEIYSKLVETLSNKYLPKRSVNYWKARFSTNSFEIIAAVLVDSDGEIHGALGCVEHFNGFCGLSVWWTDPRFRNKSLSLLLFLLEHLGTTPIINSSANATARQVFRRLNGWVETTEYIGFPKRLINTNRNYLIYRYPRVNVVLDKKFSLSSIVFRSLLSKKFVLFLTLDRSEILFGKKLTVFSKNINARNQVISHYGDRFD